MHQRSGPHLRIIAKETLKLSSLNYDAANDALLAEWDKLDPSFLDTVLQKQQNRLEQLAERINHEEQVKCLLKCTHNLFFANLSQVNSMHNGQSPQMMNLANMLEISEHC